MSTVCPFSMVKPKKQIIQNIALVKIVLWIWKAHTYSCSIKNTFLETWRLRQLLALNVDWMIRWCLHDARLREWNLYPSSRGRFHPYDYMRKSNTIPARRDICLPSTCLDMFIFYFCFPLEACLKLLFHHAQTGWSNYMGKFRPGKAAFQLYERGIPSHWGETFHMLSHEDTIYGEFIVLLVSLQNGTEFHSGQRESSNHYLNIKFLRVVIIS